MGNTVQGGTKHATLTLPEITKNLDKIRTYIRENSDELDQNARKQIETFFHDYAKNLKRYKGTRNKQEAVRVMQRMEVIRAELKQIQTAPTPTNYTLPRVNKLINLFEGVEDTALITSSLDKQPSKKMKKTIASATKDLQLIENLIKNKTIQNEDADKVQAKLIRLAHQFQRQKNKDPDAVRLLEKISSLQAQIVQVGRAEEENVIKRKTLDARTSSNLSKKLAEHDLDKASIETLSFTHYPAYINEIFDKIGDNLKLLHRVFNESITTCKSNELEQFAVTIEDFEAQLKSIKQQIYQENFKWTKKQSSEYLNQLQNIEKELNKTDFVQSLREKGKDPTIKTLKELENRTSRILDESDDVMTKKQDIFTYIHNQEETVNAIYIDAALSKMEEDHNRFKARIRKFNDSESSKDFKSFLKYLYELRKYPLKFHSQDKVLQERKQALLADIDDSIRTLNEKALKFDTRTDAEIAAEKEAQILVKLLNTYTNQLDDLAEKVQKVTSVSPLEHDSLKSTLELIRNNILSLNITEKTATIGRSREKYLQRIDQLFDQLPKKEILRHKKNDDNSQSRVDSLKKKVERFSGSYQNVLYRSIERDLRKILQEIEQDVTDTELAQNLSRDIIKQLKILEEKSSKETSYANNELNESQKTLTLVRNKIDKMRDNNDPNLDVIKKDMDFCYDKLDGLVTRDQSVQEARMSLYREIKEVSTLTTQIQKKTKELNVSKLPQEENIKTLTRIKTELVPIKERIVKLNEGGGDIKELQNIKHTLDVFFSQLAEVKELSLVEERSTLFKDVAYWSEILERKIQRSPTTLEEIEATIDEITPEILQFVGEESSENYLHLDEVLVDLTTQLNMFENVDTNSLDYLRKMKAVRMINDLSDELEGRASQCEKIGELEKRSIEMMLRIDGLPNNLQLQDLTALHEEVGKLVQKIKEFDANEQLNSKKELLVGQLNECRNKLNELSSSQVTSF